MAADLEKDRRTSFSILNYLRAGYQGKFAFLNILSQFQHPSFSAAELEAVQQTNTKITNWITELYSGVCLFSEDWKQAETFDAQEVLNLLYRLKADYTPLVKETQRILTLQQLPSEQDIRLLIAAIFRNNYARETYFFGFVDFLRKFGPKESVKQYEDALNFANNAVSFCQQLANAYREAGLNIQNLEQRVLGAIHQNAAPLPITFRTLIHDINQMVAPAKGGLTFNNLDFAPEEAKPWEHAAISAVAAGYWRAWNFTAEDAKSWLNQKFLDPAGAAAWRGFGFTPESSIPWAMAGFAPDYAALWLRAGYDPERAMRAIESGIRQPPPPPQEPAGSQQK